MACPSPFNQGACLTLPSTLASSSHQAALSFSAMISLLSLSDFLRSSAASLTPGSIHSRPSSSQTHTSASRTSRSEHWRVSEHVGDDKEANMAPTDIDLIEMADTAVPSSDGDVSQLNIHVVFRCRENVSLLQDSVIQGIWR